MKTPPIRGKIKMVTCSSVAKRSMEEELSSDCMRVKYRKVLDGR